MRAVVTGASRGIGAAIAAELARSGWDVALIGRDQSALTMVIDRCKAANPQASFTSHVIDMSDHAAFEQFVAEDGPIDLYVSNHGILDGRKDGELVESAQAAATVIDINLSSSVSALLHVVERMRHQAHGRIGLVSSLGGLSPLPDAPAYAASKAGLIAYGLSLREALRGSGVTVSVVCPGYVSTSMAAEHLGNRPHEISADDAAKRILRAILNGKRLTGFPFPLWPMALFGNLVPEGLFRLFSKDLRFVVSKRG